MSVSDILYTLHISDNFLVSSLGLKNDLEPKKLNNRTETVTNLKNKMLLGPVHGSLIRW